MASQVLYIHTSVVIDYTSLANLAVSADQSDFTEAISFNYIHSFAVALLCCTRVASSTCEIEIERAVLHAIDGVQVLGC